MLSSIVFFIINSIVGFYFVKWTIRFVTSVSSVISSDKKSQNSSALQQRVKSMAMWLFYSVSFVRVESFVMQ